MPFLIGLVALLGVAMFWILRANSTVKAAKDLDYETKGMQRTVKNGLQDVFGTRLARIRDARLAAVVLMIQLVRTGSPVTASEKTVILDLMEDPLNVEHPAAMFERAWGYTEYRRFFSLAADELLPFLRRQLAPPERLQLVEMLTLVANAYGDASDLQKEGITRLKRRLMASPSGHDQTATGDFRA